MLLALDPLSYFKQLASGTGCRTAFPPTAGNRVSFSRERGPRLVLQWTAPSPAPADGVDAGRT